MSKYKMKGIISIHIGMNEWEEVRGWRSTHVPHLVQHDLNEVGQTQLGPHGAAVELHQQRQKLEEWLGVVEHWVGGTSLHRLRKEQHASLPRSMLSVVPLSGLCDFTSCIAEHYVWILEVLPVCTVLSFLSLHPPLFFWGGGGGSGKGEETENGPGEGREREGGGRKGGGGWGGQTYTQIQNRYWHWEQGPGTNLSSHCSGNHRCADFSQVHSSSNHRHFTEIPQESQMPQTQFLTSGLSFLMALKMVFTICTNTQTLQSIKTWGDVSFLMVLRMVFMICTDRQPLKSTKTYLVVFRSLTFPFQLT